jgi:hypothetical protein
MGKSVFLKSHKGNWLGIGFRAYGGGQKYHFFIQDLLLIFRIVLFTEGFVTNLDGSFA